MLVSSEQEKMHLGLVLRLMQQLIIKTQVFRLKPLLVPYCRALGFQAYTLNTNPCFFPGAGVGLPALQQGAAW